jgi:hypothetical protein
VLGLGPSEEHHPLTQRIGSQARHHPRPRPTSWSDIHPVLTIPVPGVSLHRPSHATAAEEQNAACHRIETHRRTSPRTRAMLRAALVPAHTIPLPGLLHRLWPRQVPDVIRDTSRRAPIHDHHLAIGVVGHSMRQALGALRQRMPAMLRGNRGQREAGEGENHESVGAQHAATPAQGGAGQAIQGARRSIAVLYPIEQGNLQPVPHGPKAQLPRSFRAKIMHQLSEDALLPQHRRGRDAPSRGACTAATRPALTQR